MPPKFCHELCDALTDETDTTRQHFEPVAGEFARRPDGDDDNCAGGGVFVGARRDLHGRSEWDSVLKIEGFAQGFVRRAVDEDELVGETIQEKSVGAAGADVAAADD